jgi:hypothetical protein
MDRACRPLCGLQASAAFRAETIQLTNASIINPYLMSHLLSMLRVSFVFLKFRPTMRAPPANESSDLRP